MEIEEPFQEKIDCAVDGLKNNKAPSENGVVAELLRKGGMSLREKLSETIRFIWRTEKSPRQMEHSYNLPYI